MKRRGTKRSSTIEHRPEQEAANLRVQAQGMPPSIRREELLRKARQAENAARVTECLRSRGLPPPE